VWACGASFARVWCHRPEERTPSWVALPPSSTVAFESDVWVPAKDDDGSAQRLAAHGHCRGRCAALLFTLPPSSSFAFKRTNLLVAAPRCAKRVNLRETIGGCFAAPVQTVCGRIRIGAGIGSAELSRTSAARLPMLLHRFWSTAFRIRHCLPASRRRLKACRI